jgi:hypothetical protein
MKTGNFTSGNIDFPLKHLIFYNSIDLRLLYVFHYELLE